MSPTEQPPPLGGPASLAGVPAPVPGAHGRDPVQVRTVSVLALTQVLVGVGTATGASVNSLIAAEVSGSETVGGLAQTCVVVGSALAALPIAQVAARHGRRRSLVIGYGVAALGALGATTATVRGSTALLLVGMTLIGAGGAAGLAARFAATDLAAPEHRARALSLVIWAATIGSVLGPNLAGWLDGWALGAGLLPAARGTHSAVTFALMLAMFVLATAVVAVLLRPDPLLLARELMGVALPGPIDAWSRRDRTARSLARQVCTSWILVPPGAPPAGTDFWFHFRERERWRDRIPYALHNLRLAVAPSEKDRAFVQLPKALSALYLFVRPVRITLEKMRSAGS